MTFDDFHAIIPAGGSGTRLWPLSRRDRPKFLLDLSGSGRTLLQQTWDRLERLVGPDRIHVVTGAAHADAVREQLPALRHIVVEPTPRDSMPAIGLAAALIETRHRGAVIGSFAADHLVTDDAAFGRAVAEAVTVARTGLVCTIGITPSGPSTAFGYIEAGRPLGLPDAPGAVAVSRFVEKPNAATAAGYVAHGGFRWNAGMFVATASTLLDHLARLRPALHQGLLALAANGPSPDPARWDELEKIAIDHAIAEPVAAAGGIAMVPGEFDWFDVGDIAALAQLRDERDGGSRDGVLLHDADGLVIDSPGRSVTVLGIHDVVVIDTGDAILVTTLDHAQQVKELPAAWVARGRPDLT